jgi:hypothetical protein
MRTFRTSLSLAVALVLGLLTWTACDSAGTMSDDPGSDAQGQFTLRLTDAPANVDSAVVTVERVELVGEDAEDDRDEDGEEDNGEDDNGDDDNGDDDEDDGDDEDNGIITLTDSTRQIDLLQLQDGVTTTLADVTVPAGSYSQIRFILGSDNYIVLNDGSRQTLQVPSGMQTGIKVILPELEVANDGDQIDVTLDFDVDESLIQTGASGRYLFKPTIKVKSASVNGEDVTTVEVDGPVTSVDATAQTVAVDSIPFAVTAQTEFDAESGLTSLADVQVGQQVGVDGTLRDDGTLAAREIERETDDESEREITAPVEAIGSGTLTLLGTTIEVTSSTEFDDILGLGDLQTGDRVEVEYVASNGTRVATEIEREDG